MRRRISICLLALLCLLSACGREKAPEATDWTPEQMVRAILDTQDTRGAAADAFRYGDGLFGSYLSDYYGLEPGDVADGYIFCTAGVSALEVAVLRMADGADAEHAAEILTEYIDARAGAFAGYAPEQYAILERSAAVSRGQYAALLICPDADAAEKAFADCFTSAPPAVPAETTQPAQPDGTEAPSEAAETQPAQDRLDTAEPFEPAETQPAGPEPTEETGPTEEPDPAEEIPASEETQEPEPVTEPAPEPEEPWSYDEQRVLDAWNGGSREGLPEQDLAILAVLETIPALTDGSLTDYERELALHDWMIAWAEYDPGALSSGPRGEPMPDNDNPYGFLTGKKGICLGYTSTFQLLMDLSGIECLSVNGTAHSGTADHAWNLVRLDGDWYAVDVTWDDPVSSFPVSRATAHNYFNVTDSFLRAHDHQWAEDEAPEAAGTAWSWKR